MEYAQHVQSVKSHPPITMRNRHCECISEDGKFLIVANFDIEINNDSTKVQEFLNHFDRLDEIQLRTAEDGIYNWVIYTTKEQERLRFVCSKMVSPLETGIRHQAIVCDNRLQVHRVIAAGECKKEGSQIIYNFQSGTYMEHQYKNLSIEKYSKLEETMKGIFSQFVKNARFWDRNQNCMKPTKVIPKSQLKLYKHIGCKIIKVENQSVCRIMNYRIHGRNVEL